MFVFVVRCLLIVLRWFVVGRLIVLYLFVSFYFVYIGYKYLCSGVFVCV